MFSSKNFIGIHDIVVKIFNLFQYYCQVASSCCYLLYMYNDSYCHVFAILIIIIIFFAVVNNNYY